MNGFNGMTNNLYITFDKIEDSCMEVKNILNKVSNILSEDILISEVGYKVEDIKLIKSKIDVLNKQ